jgi:hypothetical protein
VARESSGSQQVPCRFWRPLLSLCRSNAVMRSFHGPMSAVILAQLPIMKTEPLCITAAPTRSLLLMADKRNYDKTRTEILTVQTVASRSESRQCTLIPTKPCDLIPGSLPRPLQPTCASSLHEGTSIGPTSDRCGRSERSVQHHSFNFPSLLEAGEGLAIDCATSETATGSGSPGSASFHRPRSAPATLPNHRVRY